MTKKVIAIISVLKPVDDARNYEKLARSIGNTNKYDINIIGFHTKNIPKEPNIRFYPIFNFARISLGRLLAPYKILKILIKLKPELTIVTCAELLLVSISNKILFGGKIIYDIQENYYLNILHTNSYPAWLRYPLAFGLRVKERICSRFIDGFILAEKVYKSQLSYYNDNTLILENKAVVPLGIATTNPDTNGNLHLVYSGTITEHYGIYEAIRFAIHLRSNIENVTLTIIGFAPKNRTLEKIKDLTKGMDYIQIIGGAHLVPHDQIVKTMKNSTFCLLPYQKNKSTEGRIPTKLYECLAMEIPVIISPNVAWDSLIHDNNAGIIHDFGSKESFDASKLKYNFYGLGTSSIYEWKQTEKMLQQMVEKTMHEI